MLKQLFFMNRTPSPILQHKSPYEILHQQLPNYSDFRTFGTLCYASTLLSTWHKFSPRATATVFTGYPHGYKSYKLLDWPLSKLSYQGTWSSMNTSFLSKTKTLQQVPLIHSALTLLQIWLLQTFVMILTIYTHNNIQKTNQLYKTILSLTLFQKISSEDQLDNVAHQDTLLITIVTM